MLSSDYIVGLTDGEGCFYVNIRPPDKRCATSKHSIETHFYIKMREDELELLKKVKEFFGCGAIYFQKDKRPTHASCYRYEINSRKNVSEVLIPFFDKNTLESAKRKNYLIFREIATLVAAKAHLNDDGFERVRQLKFQMNK